MPYKYWSYSALFRATRKIQLAIREALNKQCEVLVGCSEEIIQKDSGSLKEGSKKQVREPKREDKTQNREDKGERQKE